MDDARAVELGVAQQGPLALFMGAMRVMADHFVHIVFSSFSRGLT
jgi:hypothetical protein